MISFSKPFNMTRLKIELLAFFATFSLFQSYPLYLKPGKIDSSHHQPFAIEFLKFKEKNPSTVNAKHGEVNEFCYLSIKFQSKRQTCGCFLLDKYHVVTSARCLME